MKKLILAALAVTTFLSLSGCGSDNNLVFPTKAAITFAAMSSNSSVVPYIPHFGYVDQSTLLSSTTGVQYLAVSATLPLYANVSTTTAPRPTSGQFDANMGLNGGLQTYNNPKRISPSALVTAGPFANNSSVSKRTKINGYVSTDPIQQVKRVVIFLVYSSPRTPGATVVKGSSVDFATLNVTYPMGSPLTQELIQEMNKSLWDFQYNNQLYYESNFYFLPPSAVGSWSPLTHTVPTVSTVILGF